MGAGSSRNFPNPEAEEYFEIERILVENKIAWHVIASNEELSNRMNQLIETLKIKAKFDDRITTMITNIDGEIEAQYQLGFLYSEGRGIEKDDEKAVYYLQEASRRGHVEASYLLGCLIYNDRGVPKETKTPQFNQYRAVVLWTKCAETGHADAERKLGDAYMSGVGVKEVDIMKASQHYANATDKAAANAYHQIGEMYETGKGGLKKDDGAAAKRYELSANEGNAIAKYRLGSMYMEGRGVTKDKEKAINLIESAVEQGNAHAQYHLAIIAAQSDPFRAIGLLNHAAIQGHKKARDQLQRVAKGERIQDDEIEKQSKFKKAVRNVMQNLKKMRSNDIVLESMAADAILSNLENPDAKIENNSIQHHDHPEYHHSSSSLSMSFTRPTLSLDTGSGGGGGEVLASPPKSSRRGGGGILSGIINTLSPKRYLVNKSKVAPDNKFAEDENNIKPVVGEEVSSESQDQKPPPKRSVVNSTTASSKAKTVSKSNISSNKNNKQTLKKSKSKANNFRFV